MKNGPRTFDARSAVARPRRSPVGRGTARVGDDEETSRTVSLKVDPACAILQLVVRHTTPAVRPDDVLAALRSQAHLAPPSPPRMTRLAQGPLDEENGAVADPLAADRNAVGA